MRAVCRRLACDAGPAGGPSTRLLLDCRAPLALTLPPGPAMLSKRPPPAVLTVEVEKPSDWRG